MQRRFASKVGNGCCVGENAQCHRLLDGRKWHVRAWWPGKAAAERSAWLAWTGLQAEEMQGRVRRGLRLRSVGLIAAEW